MTFFDLTNSMIDDVNYKHFCIIDLSRSLFFQFNGKITSIQFVAIFHLEFQHFTLLHLIRSLTNPIQSNPMQSKYLIMVYHCNLFTFFCVYATFPNKPYFGAYSILFVLLFIQHAKRNSHMKFTKYWAIENISLTFIHSFSIVVLFASQRPKVAIIIIKSILP